MAHPLYRRRANGQRIEQLKQGVKTTYRCNPDHRLTAVLRNDVLQATYRYNPYGQRIRKVVNGTTTWFLYTPSGLTAEYDEAGNLLREYQFKPNQPWMTDPLLQRTATGAVYYYQNDHLGTPQRLLSDTGAVVWEASYQAFGEATVVKALVSNPLRFSGQYYDKETNAL